DDEAVGGCAGIERRALERLLAGQRVAPTRLSDACYGSTALRLRALGFEWAPAWSATLGPERFDSPLVARLANGTQGRTDLAPDDTQRTRLAALLARLQGPPS